MRRDASPSRSILAARCRRRWPARGLALALAIASPAAARPAGARRRCSAQRATFLFFVPGGGGRERAVGALCRACSRRSLGAAAGLWCDCAERAGRSRQPDRGRRLPAGRRSRSRSAASGSSARGVERRTRRPRTWRAREAHLRSILETVPDAMVVIDEAGLIRDFSPAAERLFGWTADEVIGPQRQHADARRPIASAHDGYLAALLPHRRAADHRHRPGRRRRAQGRLDLPDGACGRRDAGRRASASSPASSAT